MTLKFICEIFRGKGEGISSNLPSYPEMTGWKWISKLVALLDLRYSACLDFVHTIIKTRMGGRVCGKTLCSEVKGSGYPRLVTWPSLCLMLLLPNCADNKRWYLFVVRSSLTMKGCTVSSQFYSISRRSSAQEHPNSGYYRYPFGLSWSAF